MTRRCVPSAKLRWRNEVGASAVEFALVAPLLIALLIGITTAGLTWNRSVSMNESVREGSRFGATTLSSASWGNLVRDRVVALSADGLTTGQVCASLMKGPGLTPVQTSTCTITAPVVPVAISSALASTDCLVVVWAQRPSSISPLPFFSYSLSLQRHMFQRYERVC